MIFRDTAFNDFANHLIFAGTPVSLNHFSGGVVVCHAGFAFNCHLDDLPVKIGNFPQQVKLPEGYYWNDDYYIINGPLNQEGSN